MDVKWETPPHAKAGRNVRPEEVELARELRSHPDQWARFVEFTGDDRAKAAAIAQTIRKGERSAFRSDPLRDGGEFESVSRKIPDTDITAVYVRFATLHND